MKTTELHLQGTGVNPNVNKGEVLLRPLSSCLKKTEKRTIAQQVVDSQAQLRDSLTKTRDNHGHSPLSLYSTQTDGRYYSAGRVRLKQIAPISSQKRSNDHLQKPSLYDPLKSPSKASSSMSNSPVNSHINSANLHADWASNRLIKGSWETSSNCIDLIAAQGDEVFTKDDLEVLKYHLSPESIEDFFKSDEYKEWKTQVCSNEEMKVSPPKPIKHSFDYTTDNTRSISAPPPSCSKNKSADSSFISVHSSKPPILSDCSVSKPKKKVTIGNIVINDFEKVESYDTIYRDVRFKNRSKSCIIL